MSTRDFIEKKLVELISNCEKDKTVVLQESLERKFLYVLTKNPHGKFEIYSRLFNNEFGESLSKKAYKEILLKYGIKKNIFKDNGIDIVHEAQKLAETLVVSVFENEDCESARKSLAGNRTDEKTVYMAFYYLCNMIPKISTSDMKGLILGINYASVLEILEMFASGQLGNEDDAKKVSEKNEDEFVQELLQLERERDRANNLLSKLQAEFDVRVSDNKKEVQENLIKELNSSKYDYILDKLTTVQNGLRQLRRERIAVPLQINSVPSLVREMMQFIEDCGITPMLELGEEFEISGKETEYYVYEGNPFHSVDEKKMVRVVSTGWEIKEKELIISQPTVKEIISE